MSSLDRWLSLLQETESWRQQRGLWDLMWKASLEMPHVWWHMTPDKMFSAIRVYKLSFLFLLLEYRLKFIGFLVVVWSLSPWRTSLFPSLLEYTIPKPYFQQEKYLSPCFKSSASRRKNFKRVILHCPPEIWYCTAYIPSQFTAKFWSKNTKLFIKPHAKGSQDIIFL